MEKLAVSKELERSNEGVGQEKCNNCGNDGNNSLLCAFIEYAWDENDAEHFECKSAELTRWLASKDLIDNDKLCCFLSGLDADVTTKIMTDDKIQGMWEKLAFKLKEVLPILIASKDDVNYVNDNNQTFLHVFVEKCLKYSDRFAGSIISKLRKLMNYVVKGKDQFSRNEIFKLRKLMNFVVQRKASFCVRDKHGKCPLHYAAATCKSPEILQSIVSSLTNSEASNDFVNTIRHMLLKDCVDKKANDEAGYVDIILTVVCESASDVNAKNDKGETLAHLAAQRFHVEVLKFLADKGANFDARTDKDETPLHFACSSTLKLTGASKIIETLNLLAYKGCDLEAADSNGHKPLHRAAEFGTLAIFEGLIALGVDVDSRTEPLLLTPLYLAAKSDKLESMKALIVAGADVDAEGVDGSTPLFMSVMLGSYQSMKFLMDQSAELHRRENVTGFTLLHMAAYDANQVLSRKLDAFIDEGFDVNDAGPSGITPLQLAAVRENFDHVQILIERGADVNYRRDRSELTALHLAVTHLGIVKVLLENGADVDCRGGANQMTPLQMLLAPEFEWQLGKYPDVKQYMKASYLHKYWSKAQGATAWSCNRLVGLFLEHGANVNVKDAAGMTPLHYAALHYKLAVMKVLLEAGARTNVQNRDGRVPIHGFLENDGAVEGLRLLLNFGADMNDEDTSQMIIDSGDELKNAAVEHAIKRKLIGLFVARVYESLIGQPAFANFHEQCSKEASNLMSHRDDAGFSIYEFLRMNAKFQYHAIKKIEDTRENLNELFPVYANLIFAACRESASRRPLLELARIIWTETFKTLLPAVCVEIILSYLSNRYLEVFVAKPVEKISIDQERKSVIVGAVERTN